MAMVVVVIAVVMVVMVVVVMVVSVVRVIVVVVVSFPLCNRVVNGVPFKENVEMGIVVMVMPAVVEAVVVMVVVTEEAVAEVAVVMVVVPVRVGTALYQVGTANEKLNKLIEGCVTTHRVMRRNQLPFSATRWQSFARYVLQLLFSEKLQKC